MVHTVRRIVAIFVAASWLGCASVPLAPPHEDEQARRLTPPADKALVYVFRSGWLAALSTFPLYANSERIGELAVNTYYVLETDPGDVRLEFPFSDGAATLVVQAEAGKRYFVQQRLYRTPLLLVSIDTAALEEVDEAYAEQSLGHLVRRVRLERHAELDQQARAIAAAPGASLVYVMRRDLFGRTDFDVTVRGEAIGKLSPRSFVVVEVPSGPVALAVEAENRAELSVQAAADGAHFVLAIPRFGFGSPRVELREVDEPTGRRLLTDLRIANGVKR